MNGSPNITLNARQQAVLQMLYLGEPMKNMAEALRLKPKGVEYHLYRLYHLTRSRCAVQAVRWGGGARLSSRTQEKNGPRLSTIQNARIITSYPNAPYH